MKSLLYKLVCFWLLLTSSIKVPLANAQEILPLNEVKPGMQGLCKTVFEGTRIEDFGIEVLEIIKNFYPQKDVILVRLTGPIVEKTGVVSGMSGSPVYIDGKLVGALAYRVGSFQKEPIAGVTPIEQMMEIVSKEKVRQQEMSLKLGGSLFPVELALGLHKNGLEEFFLQSLRLKKLVTTSLSPIQTPLVFSGFQGKVIQRFAGFFEELGFIPLQGGYSAEEPSQTTEPGLVPGAPVSGVLIDGDMSLSGTGTITYRDKNQILAFGHSFFDSGPVKLPMAEAKILTTMSSLMSSYKISQITQVVGSIHQDRTTGILGIIGEPPVMIPVTVRYHSPFQETQTFRFRVAEEKSLNSYTPLFLWLALLNAVESARLAEGEYSLNLKGTIQLKDHKAIILDNFFAGSTSATDDVTQATGEVAAVIASLLMNNFKIPKIENIELDFHCQPGKKLAEIEGVWYDKSEVKPGESLNLVIFIRPFQGKIQKIAQKVKIPSQLSSGWLTLWVGSAEYMMNLEKSLTPMKFQPQDFSQLIQLLNTKKKNHILFLQLRKPDKGAIIQGQELPSLPPS
ncbi:MAG: hypothetical protein ONB05_06565, partial [candidate division KSB1 bacterium]|nr:hypothetical protein [candidate division KSB1 bacterium]